MTVRGYPYETQDTSESEYANIFRELQDPGVLGSFGDGTLKATATGTSMAVSIAAGRAYANGFVLDNDGAATVTVTAASAGARVDRIVARIDPGANTSTLVHKPGTSGSSTPPALTQTATGVYEVPLYRVAVGAGATVITTANLTDERPWAGHRVGVWTTDTRPAAPRTGRMGWNTTIPRWEFWDGTTWSPVTPAALDASVINTGTVGFARLPVGTSSTQVARGDHTHDDRYFTEQEVTDLLAGKANSTHTHSAAQIGSGYPATAVGSSGLGFATNVDAAITWLRDNKADVGAAASADKVTSAAYGRTVGSSYYSMWMDGALNIGRNTSSRRYKRDIRAAAADGLDDAAMAAVVDALQPRTYVRKADENGHRDLGLIAEEVERVAPWLVVHDVPRTKAGVPVRNGKSRPETVAYETTLVVALVGALKHTRTELAEVRERLAALEGR